MKFRVNRTLVISAILCFLLLQCVTLCVKSITDRLAIRRADTSREKSIVTDLAEQIDALQEALLLEISVQQYSLDLRLLTRSRSRSASAADGPVYASIAGRLSDIIEVNRAIIDARLLLPEQGLVVGVSGVEPLSTAVRRDPDTFLFLESYRAQKHVWIPQHRAFVEGCATDVLVLVMPMTTAGDTPTGIYLVYLCFTYFAEPMRAGLSDGDYLFVLNEEDDVLLANGGRQFLRSALIPKLSKNLRRGVRVDIEKSNRETSLVSITVPSSRSGWKYVGVFTLPAIAGAGSAVAVFIILILLNLVLTLAAALLLRLSSPQRRTTVKAPAQTGRKKEQPPSLSLHDYPTGEHHRLFAALRQKSAADRQKALERFLRSAQQSAHDQSEYCDFVTLMLFSYLQELPEGRSMAKAKAEVEILRTAIPSRQSSELKKELLRFFRSYSLSAQTRVEQIPGDDALTPAQLTALDRAIAFIHLRYTQCISAKEIASIAGFSPQHFCSIFRLYTGRAVADYLSELRLEMAKRLLVETNDPISLVAERSGYASIQSFSRIFRHLTSFTPQEYRKIERQFEYPSLAGSRRQD